MDNSGAREPEQVEAIFDSTSAPVMSPSNTNVICANLYSATFESNHQPVQPFVHKVGLRSPSGITTYLPALFDNGAMVNAISSAAYTSLRNRLGPLQPSARVLRMANGYHVPSMGTWIGKVLLGQGLQNASFEVFPGGEGWKVLFGKPLLKKFRIVEIMRPIHC